jgi:hypothetical protein
MSKSLFPVRLTREGWNDMKYILMNAPKSGEESFMKWRARSTPSFMHQFNKEAEGRRRTGVGEG